MFYLFWFWLEMIWLKRKEEARSGTDYQGDRNLKSCQQTTHIFTRMKIKNFKIFRFLKKHTSLMKVSWKDFNYCLNIEKGDYFHCNIIFDWKSSFSFVMRIIKKKTIKRFYNFCELNHEYFEASTYLFSLSSAFFLSLYNLHM